MLWREFRERLAPYAAFLLVLGLTGLMWRDYQRPAPLVGRVEAGRRIVAYLHPPLRNPPALDTEVVIRTRAMDRKIGKGRVLSVGRPLEAGASAGAEEGSPRSERGLPVFISLPPGYAPKPGELVNVSLSE